MSDLKQTIYLRQSSSFGPWIECEKSHPDAVAFDRRTQPEAASPALTDYERCTHPDCGRFKDGAGWSCRAMRDNACARNDAAPAQDLSAAKKEWRGSLAQVICDVPIPEGSYKYQHGFVTAKETILEALRKAGFDALSAVDRKDAERLGFIEKNARRDPKMDGNDVWWPTTFNQRLTGPTLRAAIDRAILQSQKAGHG